MLLSINKIVVPRNRERTARQLTDSITYLNILNSIRKNGLVNPICITNRNVLVDGAYRLSACLELGHTEIEVMVL